MLIRFARPGDQPRLNLHRWAKALEKGDAAKAEQFERRLRDEVFRSLEKYPDIAETLVTTQRKQALVTLFAGEHEQPRDELGRFTGGFDGGARAPLPAPRDAGLEHSALVFRLAAQSKLGRSDF